MDIINVPEWEKPCGAVMAIQLHQAIGGTPQSWLNMQTAHDLWHAEQKDIDVKPIKLKEAS